MEVERPAVEGAVVVVGGQDLVVLVDQGDAGGVIRKDAGVLASSLDLDPDGRAIIVEREIEGGRRHRLSLDLPAVITVQSGINKPRYPSLSNVLRAQRTPPMTISLENLTDRTEPTETLGLAAPTRKRAGLVLAGDTRDKAEALRKILADKGFL